MKTIAILVLVTHAACIPLKTNFLASGDADEASVSELQNECRSKCFAKRAPWPERNMRNFSATGAFAVPSANEHVQQGK